MANSKTVNSSRMINVTKAVEVLMEISANVAPPIWCMSRWPAVRFTVNRTSRATGWIDRLIVSITTSIGIRGAGVPCRRKCASDDLVLSWKPKIIVVVHNGTALPRFIDNCIVGVKRWCRKPRRLVKPIHRIREININDQVHLLVLCIVIICF